LNVLNNVRLLIREEEISIHKRGKELLHQFRDDIDLVTVWALGNYPDKTPDEQVRLRDENYERVFGIIGELKSQCVGGQAKEHQDVLCGLRAYEVMNRCLRIPGRKTADVLGALRKARTEKFNAILLDLKKACYEFLALFAVNNTNTQQALYPFVDSFMAQIEMGPHVIEAIGQYLSTLPTIAQIEILIGFDSHLYTSIQASYSRTTLP
jgi:hypothetical protein